MPKVRPINTNVKDTDIEKYASRCKDFDIEKDTAKKNQGTARISVSFSNDEIENLKHLSNKENRSLSAFIRLHILNVLYDAK